MSLPQTYGIGAPKEGTASLAALLADLPQAYFLVPEEPSYWASGYPAMHRHDGFESRDSYEQLFSSSEARAATLRQERSTNYLYRLRAVSEILAAVARPEFIPSWYLQDRGTTGGRHKRERLGQPDGGQ